jgi:purine-binding chemotaxis protein CheW
MNKNQSQEQEEQQLVIFDLVPEAYGVDINVVREIIRMQDITSVPKTPDFVKGVINLQGKVIPVVDLRKRFALADAEHTKDSRIVVVDISGQDIGIVVDAVTEVLRIPNSAVSPPSAIITSVDSDYLQGIAKLESKLIILLALDRVFTDEEKQIIAEGVAPAESLAVA